MNSGINPISLDASIAKHAQKSSRRKAIIAAAGIAIFSTIGGITIRDCNNANNINQEVKDLKTALSDSGVSDKDLFETEQKISDNVANNTKWYDSMTKKAYARLIFWENTIRVWSMKNAYKKGTEDILKATSGCLPGLQRIPNYIEATTTTTSIFNKTI